MLFDLEQNKCYYKQQKRNARHRGVPFEITFEDWLGVWIKSQKLEFRGKKKGQYCMARYGDEGPYAIGNVEIILFSNNVRSAQLGTTKDEETRSKIAQSHLGKIRGSLSEEHRQKISTSSKGRMLSEEHKRKIASARLGKKRKPFTEEHRKRLSEGQRRRYSK